MLLFGQMFNRIRRRYCSVEEKKILGKQQVLNQTNLYILLNKKSSKLKSQLEIKNFYIPYIYNENVPP